MKVVSFAAIMIKLLASAQAEPVADDPLAGAFRTIMGSDDFNSGLFLKFTPAAVRAASPEALAAVRKSCSVYHVDFDCDGLVDCVIQLSPGARNSEFFAVRRLQSGWQISCHFVAQAFNFSGFAGRTQPLLETMQRLGGGDLLLTTYIFRDGRFEQNERHREKLKSDEERPEQ